MFLIVLGDLDMACRSEGWEGYDPLEERRKREERAEKAREEKVLVYGLYKWVMSKLGQKRRNFQIISPIDDYSTNTITASLCSTMKSIVADEYNLLLSGSCNKSVALRNWWDKHKNFDKSEGR